MTDQERKAAEMALEALEELKKDVTGKGAPEHWDAYYAKQGDALDALRQALQRPVKSYTNGEPQYATEDMSTKPQNVDTSAERVHAIDKSIHDLRAAAEMALEALDMAQSLLEKSRHHKQILDAYIDLRQALAQPEQTTIESVYETIVRWDEGGGKRSRRELARRVVALRTAPPSKPWVSLTDEEVIDVYCKQADGTEWAIGGLKDAMPFAKAIEAALRSKNNG
jgi:hypothetical protein